MTARLGLANRAYLPPGRRRFLDIHLGPAMGAVTAVLLAQSGRFVATLLMVAAGFGVAVLVTVRLGRHSFVLPLMRHVRVVVGAVVAGVAMLAIERWLLRGAWTRPEIAAVVGVTVLGGGVGHWILRRARRHGWFSERVAVLGTASATKALRQEFAYTGTEGVEVIGRIADDDFTEMVPLLGPIDRLGDLVVEHEIDMLVLTRSTPRLRVFEEVTHSCLHLPVRL